MLFLYSILSDIGLSRSIQQDDVLALPQLIHNNQSMTNDRHFDTANAGLFLVADGMGGGIHGEIASRIVRECIHEYAVTHKELIADNPYTLINDCIYYANENLLTHIKDNPEDQTMGSTVIMCIIFNNQLHLGWVGDSRCYQLSNSGHLTLLSHDHSYVQTLVDSGKLLPEDAFHHPNKNVITQSMGMANMVPSFDSFALDQVHRILLCSDGLNTMLTDDEIRSILERDASLDDINRRLIEAANDRGGEDNISSILIELVPKAIADSSIVDTQRPPTISHRKISKVQVIAGLLTLLLLAFFILMIVRLQQQGTVHADIGWIEMADENEATTDVTEDHDHAEHLFDVETEEVDAELLDSMFSESGILPEPNSYYIRLNVYLNQGVANKSVRALKSANPAIDVQMVPTSEGLFEVCLFGFDTKTEAQEFLKSHPDYSDAVIIYKN